MHTNLLQNNRISLSWLITKIILSLLFFRIISMIFFELSLSSEFVISSRIMISGFKRSNLAIAILCLSPPDKFAPFSNIFVSKPFSKFLNLSRKSNVLIFLRTSFFFRFSPSIILSNIVPLIIGIFCDYNLIYII